MRIALGIAYDGRPFDGWQSQPSGNAVQDRLEAALAQIAGGAVRVSAAGRTDAGVHATGQVVHFDVDVARPESAWVRGTNAHLPEAIAVQWALEVDAGFHARFSATSRSYSYLLYNQTSPGLMNGIRTSVNGLWLKSLVNVDPDMAFFSENKLLNPEQKQLFLDLTEICGVKATSDLPESWTDSQKSAVRRWLEYAPAITRTGRYTFAVDKRDVDFSAAMPLPPIPKYFDALLGEIMGLLGNQIWALKLWHWFVRYRSVNKES